MNIIARIQYSSYIWRQGPYGKSLQYSVGDGYKYVTQKNPAKIKKKKKFFLNKN